MSDEFPVGVELLLAAVLRELGAITISLESLVGTDYGEYQIAISQLDESHLEIDLVKVDDESE